MTATSPVPLYTAEALSTDYRAHRHARVIEGDRITYGCVCVCELHESTALRKVEWCPSHARERRDPATLDRAYFEGLGCIVDGVPQCARYLRELREVLGPFPTATPYAMTLEVGCGCSMYAPGLMSKGYYYIGTDPCKFACDWTRTAYDVETFNVPIDQYVSPHAAQYALILAAHSFEHMPDAPGAMAKCAGLLESGGELWLIVPDESDPVNPDHTWIFTAASLWRCLDAAGLEVCKLDKRRRVKHEEFIYARARKL